MADVTNNAIISTKRKQESTGSIIRTCIFKSLKSILFWIFGFVLLLIYFQFLKQSIKKSAQYLETCPAVRTPFFQNMIQLKVLVLNVWGMPEFLGSEDKLLRMRTIGQMIYKSEYDLYLLSELWLKSDHLIIKSWLPPGYFMTEVGEFSLPSCDGVISPWDCSGLAIISRFSLLQTKFIPFDAKGDWNSVDGEFWAQKGAGKVRIEPSWNFTCDIYITHTCASGPSYTNEWYRQKQAEQISEMVRTSDADFVIVGGDLNTDPTDKETTFNILEKVLVNCFQESSVTPAKWLTPALATYGNPSNSYSNKYSPVVYDYIWHKAGGGNKIWTSFFDVVLLRTKKEIGEEEEVEVSLSDHEAVTASLVLWKPLPRL